MNGQIAAVFDLDRTLTAVRSVESLFLRFLIQEHHIGIMNIVRSAVYYLRNILRDPVEATKRNKMYLRGFSVEELDNLSKIFLSKYGDRLIPPESRKFVQLHKNNEHQTILITGSPEFLVYPLMQLCDLSFNYLYATRLKVESGYYNGRIEGIHYYGKEKEELVRTLSIDLGFSLIDSYCYADSKSDIPMMSLFGKPVAVNPDKELSKKSLRSNWQIVTTACS